MRKAITFVEVIVVVAILLTLIALALPAVQKVRRSADILKCKSNLRQMGIAFHNRHASHGQFSFPDTSTWLANRQDLLGWMVHMLPDIEQDAVFSKAIQDLELSRDTSYDPRHTGLAKVIPLYVCPTDTRLYTPRVYPNGIEVGYTSYLGVLQVQKLGPIQVLTGPQFLTAPLGMSKQSFSLIKDGVSNTAMVSERPPPEGNVYAGSWYTAFYYSGNPFRCEGPHSKMDLGPDAPKFLINQNSCPEDCIVKTYLGPGRLDNPCDRFHLWSLHGLGANFLFADGSVRFLSYSANAMMPSIFSVDGGEAVEWPD